LTTNGLKEKTADLLSVRPLQPADHFTIRRPSHLCGNSILIQLLAIGAKAIRFSAFGNSAAGIGLKALVAVL
jgi:hypothetical protein